MKAPQYSLSGFCGQCFSLCFGQIHAAFVACFMLWLLFCYVVITIQYAASARSGWRLDFPGLQPFEPSRPNAVVTILGFKKKHQTDAIMKGYGIDDYAGSIKGKKVWTDDNETFCALMIQVVCARDVEHVSGRGLLFSWCKGHLQPIRAGTVGWRWCWGIEMMYS